jgi:hypothetical protein
MTSSTSPSDERLNQLMQQLMERTSLASRLIGSTATSRIVIYSHDVPPNLPSSSSTVSESLESNLGLAQLLKASILDQQLSWNLPDLRHEHIVDEFHLDEVEEEEEGESTTSGEGGPRVSGRASQTVLRPPENLSVISFVIGGDRGAGKSTFVAALCSGASPVLQVLRIHRAQFHNCWFGLGASPERVLSNLVQELSTTVRPDDATAVDEGPRENTSDWKAGTGEMQTSRRLAPWLATELSFGALELEPSELMYFLDDDELVARNRLLCSEGVVGAGGDSSTSPHRLLYGVPTRKEESELDAAGASSDSVFNELMRRATNSLLQRMRIRHGSQSEALYNIETIPQHAVIRWVEIGGDLLESLSSYEEKSETDPIPAADGKKPFWNSAVQLQVHRAVVEAMGRAGPRGRGATNGQPQALAVSYFVNAETSLSSDDSVNSLLNRLTHFCGLALGPRSVAGHGEWTLLQSLLVSKFHPFRGGVESSQAFAPKLIQRLPNGRITSDEDVLSVLRRLRDLATRSLERHFPNVSIEIDVTTFCHVRDKDDAAGAGVEMDFSGVVTTAHRLLVRSLAANANVGEIQPFTTEPVNGAHPPVSAAVVSCAAQLVALMHEHRLPWCSRRLLQHLLFDDTSSDLHGGCCGNSVATHSHGRKPHHLTCGEYSVPIHPLSAFVEDVAASGSAMYVLDQYEAAASFLAERYSDQLVFVPAPDDGQREGLVSEGALLLIRDTEVGKAMEDPRGRSATDVVKAHKISLVEREKAATVLNGVLESLLSQMLH